MAQQDKLTITKAAIARLADCGDPRFKEVMTALIRHLHDFVREVDLTEEEWAAAIGFLTDTGRKLAQDGRRRHEIVEEFLLAIGVASETARIDAEGIEHHVSGETLAAMEAYLKSRGA